MGKDSTIEWTDHTFNPWWGCTKVSPACKHCYAETWARRFGMDLWGGRSPRREFGDAHWREPLRWNRDAVLNKTRRRVFCASMGDVFEPRRDLDASRERLWRLIEQTPGLDWLLLTKRPDRIAASVPWDNSWPENIWLGTTAESQLWAERRIPFLLQHRAAVRFVSCEPLLGHLDLTPWLPKLTKDRALDWVIVGGESGRKARPMQPLWARSLQQQCYQANVAFHFKQWGNWAPIEPGTDTRANEKQGRQLLTINEFERVSKKTAGRMLDGRTWDQLPLPRPAKKRAAE